MKLTSISEFLSGKTTALQLKVQIEPDIAKYKNTVQKIGASSPIYLVEDLQNLIVGNKEVLRLCESYLNGDLNDYELNYIAEALLLSNKVEVQGDTAGNSLLVLTDVDYFKNVSPQYIQDVIDEIEI